MCKNTGQIPFGFLDAFAAYLQDVNGLAQTSRRTEGLLGMHSLHPAPRLSTEFLRLFPEHDVQRKSNP